MASLLLHPLDAVIQEVDRVQNIINHSATTQDLQRAREYLAAAHRDLINEIESGGIDAEGSDMEETLRLYLRMDLLTKYLQLMRP